MSARLRTLALLALLVVLAGFAAFPLFSAGFLGEDLRCLLRGSDLAWPQGAPRTAGLLWSDAGGPLANLSLALTSRIHSTRGAWDGSEATFVRIENWLLLLAAAAVLGCAARRALAPWTGAAGAEAAAFALALLVACHPACVPLVAGSAQRGDLLAMIFGAVSAASFLRARQDRSHGAMALAAAAALLAGLSSGLALLLPPALALLEFTSARRHRSWHLRIRTAGTTLVVFAVCIAGEVVLALALGTDPHLPAAAREVAGALAPGRLGAVLSIAFEKLGGILLPVPRDGGAHLWIVAGALALLALQPSLAAARAAPRLWGWLALVWCGSAALALLLHASVRVPPGDLSRAALLFPAAVAVSAGLAAAATALSGSRRTWIPVVVGAGYAWLAHASALAWPAAGQVLADLRADLTTARELHGRDARFVVVDPPEREGGLDVLSGSLALLLDPRLGGGAGAAREPGDALRGLSLPALFALIGQPEFATLRRERLVLLMPASGTARRPVSVPPPSPPAGVLVWREKGRSDLIDLDPLAYRAVRVTALPDASTGRPPRMEWRSGEPASAVSGSQDGVWIAGPDGPVAIFDLSRTSAWLFGPRVRRIWFEDDLAQIVSAEVLAGPTTTAAVAGDVLTRDDAWAIDVPRDLVPRPLHVEATFVLALLDLDALRYLEVPAVFTTDGPLLFRGATPFARASRPGALAWSLELRAGRTVLWRRSGRQ